MPPGPESSTSSAIASPFLMVRFCTWRWPNFAGAAERRRGAEIDAVLAAVILAVVHRDRGHLGVAHAGLDRGEGGLHRAVLHDGAALDQLQLLGALDHLDAVDQLAGVDVFARRETSS